MTTSMIRKVVFSSIGAGLGIFAFVATQSVTKESFSPLMEACAKAPSNMPEFEKEYHAYQPLLGGSFICIITQFLHALAVEYPAGMVVWMITFTVYFPMTVLLVVEAGRSGVKGGPLLYPTAILLLGQFLGISVVFPLLWIPSYIFGRDTPKGSVNYLRACLSIVCLAPPALWTILVFNLDPAAPPSSGSSHNTWTWIAGLFFALALAPLMVWKLKPPNEKDSKPDEVYVVANSYSTAGCLSFFFWAALVFTVFKNYGLDHSAFLGDLWVNASDSVKFMVIDGLVLYLGMLTYIGYIRLTAAGEAILQTLLFGPGAAVAMIMAQLEMERFPNTNTTNAVKKNK